jgi:hypothetical protein
LLRLQASDRASVTGGFDSVLAYRSGFRALSGSFIKDHLNHVQRWRLVAAYENRVKEGLSVKPITTACIRLRAHYGVARTAR